MSVITSKYFCVPCYMSCDYHWLMNGLEKRTGLEFFDRDFAKYPDQDRRLQIVNGIYRAISTLTYYATEDDGDGKLESEFVLEKLCQIFTKLDGLVDVDLIDEFFSISLDAFARYDFVLGLEWAFAHPDCRFFEKKDGHKPYRILAEVATQTHMVCFEVLDWIFQKTDDYQLSFTAILNICIRDLSIITRFVEKLGRHKFLSYVDSDGLKYRQSEFTTDLKRKLCRRAFDFDKWQTFDFLSDLFSLEKTVNIDFEFVYSKIKDNDVEFLEWYQTNQNINLVNTNFDKIVEYAIESRAVRSIHWLLTEFNHKLDISFLFRIIDSGLSKNPEFLASLVESGVTFRFNQECIATYLKIYDDSHPIWRLFYSFRISYPTKTRRIYRKI